MTPVVKLRDCKVKDQKTNERGPILEDMKNELPKEDSKKRGRGRPSKVNITGSNAGQCKTANPAQSRTKVSCGKGRPETEKTKQSRKKVGEDNKNMSKDRECKGGSEAPTESDNIEKNVESVPQEKYRNGNISINAEIHTQELGDEVQKDNDPVLMSEQLDSDNADNTDLSTHEEENGDKHAVYDNTNVNKMWVEESGQGYAESAMDESLKCDEVDGFDVEKGNDSKVEDNFESPHEELHHLVKDKLEVRPVNEGMIVDEMKESDGLKNDKDAENVLTHTEECEPNEVAISNFECEVQLFDAPVTNDNSGLLVKEISDGQGVSEAVIVAGVVPVGKDSELLVQDKSDGQGVTEAVIGGVQLEKEALKNDNQAKTVLPCPEDHVLDAGEPSDEFLIQMVASMEDSISETKGNALRNQFKSGEMNKDKSPGLKEENEVKNDGKVTMRIPNLLMDVHSEEDKKSTRDISIVGGTSMMMRNNLKEKEKEDDHTGNSSNGAKVNALTAEYKSSELNKDESPGLTPTNDIKIDPKVRICSILMVYSEEDKKSTGDISIVGESSMQMHNNLKHEEKDEKDKLAIENTKDCDV